MLILILLMVTMIGLQTRPGVTTFPQDGQKACMPLIKTGGEYGGRSVLYNYYLYH